MYASPPKKKRRRKKEEKKKQQKKRVFMKTVASCPSDRSCGAGTGTAPLKELRGDGETNKDRERNSKERTERKKKT